MAWYKQDHDMPFAQREDSMALDVVQPRDTLRGRVWCYKDESLSLKTSDIGRCHPGGHKYLEKPDTKTPFEGNRARTYYPPRAPQEFRPTDLSLKTNDIVGCTPGFLQDKKLTTNRVVNPLQPHYQLSASEVPDLKPHINRFSARETNNISDIEKSSAKKAFPSRNHIVNNLDVSDIPGTAPKKYKPRVPYQYESDGRPSVPSCRPLCPLEPEYPIQTTHATSLVAHWGEETTNMNPSNDQPRNSSRSPIQPMNSSRPSSRSPDYQSHTIVGPVIGSKPRRVHLDNGEPQLSLVTQDVDGAVSQRWVGKTPINSYGPPPARPCFHVPDDIPGAQADCVKRGIEWSSRKTNPLDPNYPEIRGSTHKHHPNCEIIEGERGHIGRPMSLMSNRPSSQVRASGGHKRRQC